MKALIKLSIPILLVLLSMLVITYYFELINYKEIHDFLKTSQDISDSSKSLIIILILSVDIFITVPTMLTTIFAGHSLGFVKGFVVSLIGLNTSGIIGYSISFYFGENLVKFIIKDENERAKARDFMRRYGLKLISVARIIPMLPELLACMSGIERISFKKFILYWNLSCIPYSLTLCYLGTKSSLKNPTPAIIGAISISIISALIMTKIKRSQPQG